MRRKRRSRQGEIFVVTRAVVSKSSGVFLQTFGNPLIRKELRQRMRSERSILALSMYLLVMGAIAFVFMYLNVQGQTLLLQPTRTAELFTFLSYLQLAMISFVTPGIAAGVISGERERQTLTVLLTTPLSPLTIIVSKWLASISYLSLLIVMTLPLYSIVFLFGGVVPSQVIAVFWLQLVTLGAIATISVFWSTFIQRTGWATVLSYGTVAVIYILLGIAGYLIDGVAAHNPDASAWTDAATLCYALNPLFMLASIVERFGLITPVYHNTLAASLFSSVDAHHLASSASWFLFLTVYLAGSVVLLGACAWRLRPGVFSVILRRLLSWVAR